MADHCRAYALSDPKDKDYQAVCNHDHLDICDRCTLLPVVLAEIEEVLSENASTLSEKEEFIFLVRQAKVNILAWKAHLLRSVNQDDARLDMLDSLSETTVLLVQDWAMKFLPRKFRESQADWFGKRGISWHITVAFWKKSVDSEIQMMSFVHVFQRCTQDSTTVFCVMKDVIGKLKSILPNLKSVFYRQDNAGCYHSSATIVGSQLAGQFHGIVVKRMDFSDPQGGKGACDRKAATIKSHMRVHLNQGNNIETGKEMVDAIRSSGGIPGVHVTLSNAPEVQNKSTLDIKIDGVSFISNVEWKKKGSLQVWKAYKIGPGKNIVISGLSSTPKDAQIANLSKIDEDPISPSKPSEHFTTIKSKRVRSTPATSVSASPVSVASDEQANSDSESDCSLFFCSEEGCTKSYQRFSALQHHLDCGTHQRSLEHETLLDKAALGYASRLEKQHVGVPQMQLFTRSESGQPVQHPVLEMGWALKSSQVKRKRFTEKQKNYLIDKFKIGEMTKQKLDATSVAKAMMCAMDVNGKRLFDSSEYLTSQQISSFFSRLSSKRTLSTETETESDTEEDLNTDIPLNNIRNDILQDMALTHPICYDNYNICELAANSKLTKFSIQMLQNICDFFEISTADVKLKRKGPYIEKLSNLCKACTCQS